MKTFIKTIKTTLAVLSIILGLTALFTLDNNQSITTLIFQVFFMILGITVGIGLLIATYPELTDLSEFDDKSLNSLEECQEELELLREHNLLLINRYIIFKSILKSHKSADYSDMTSYPNLYHLIYVEDLAVTEEDLERFKEIYN